MQCWNQEHGFETVVELAIHQSHLEFVFEVAHRAKAPHDETRAHALGKICEQPVEGLHGDPLLVRNNFREQGHSLGYWEQRRLRRALGDTDDQPVDEMETSPNQVFVAFRRRVKGAGIDRDLALGR